MHPTPHVICETLSAGQLKLGCITLNRPSALNALSLDMVRAIAAALLAWEHDPAVLAVVMRGSGKDATAPHFGHFCAGGDIRFFHAAALAGDPALEDFFTEEYALNHRISQFPKPMLWLLDGVVMGGGMGLCAHDPQTSMRGKPVAGGMRYRVGTERTQAAMPETLIGLFPDVGGGWFLARSPGALGEYLALTGVTLKGAQACAAGWLDGMVQAVALPAMWADLAATDWQTPEQLGQWVVSKCVATNPVNTETTVEFEQKKG